MSGTDLSRSPPVPLLYHETVIKTGTIIVQLSIKEITTKVMSAPMTASGHCLTAHSKVQQMRGSFPTQRYQRTPHITSKFQLTTDSDSTRWIATVVDRRWRTVKCIARYINGQCIAEDQLLHSSFYAVRTWPKVHTVR